MAKPPVKASAKDSIKSNGNEAEAQFRSNLDAQLAAFDTYRYSWWVHWRELAEYILPRRYRWLVTPNQWNRGAQQNQKIIDNTGTRAFRTLAAGMMSGITSPARPWFRLEMTDPDLNDMPEVKLWCADTQSRMRRVMASSNYYTAKAVQYFDLDVFGTAPLLIYEDDETVIRCFNPVCGEYYCANGPRFDVTQLWRKFVMTVDQVVTEFGLANCSTSVQGMYAAPSGSSRQTEIIVGHAVYSNTEYARGDSRPGTNGVPRHFRYVECYWEYNRSTDKLLRKKGFYEQPFGCPRWDTTGNDAYGRSPAMDALGDIKQLQLEQKRKAQAIDKMVNPPMVASMNMKNEPASLLPGGITYSDNLSQTGFKPAYLVNPPILEMLKDIQECQGRIKDTAFNDLFLMISNLDTVRTATEIDARREEKLVQLGPVLDRFNDESLDPDIKRIYGIMARGGMLAPMPAVLQGRTSTLKVQYISVLADVQRASATAAIERLFQFVGNLVAVQPTAVDNLNTDEAIDEYADLLNVPPKILRDPQQVQQIRDARSQQQQQAAQMAQGQQLAEGAQTLSQTDVGGGVNALQVALQGLSGGAPGAGGGP
jgi:hypothetical protein